MSTTKWHRHISPSRSNTGSGLTGPECYLPLERPETPRDYALIGDVHSQGVELQRALAYCEEHGLLPVFLGDLFDSRCETDETLYVWNLTRIAQDEGAIVLNSNHQARLRNFLMGFTEDPSYTIETWQTLDILGAADLKVQMLEWLQGLPDGFVFKASDGLEYCCAHAFFPREMRREYETPYTVLAPTGEQEEVMVWGPYNARNRRIHWWREETNRDWVRCAGHYHTVFVGERDIVLDANCGYADGLLPLYRTDTHEVVYFGRDIDTISQTDIDKATAS